jgi:hypothetical protein
MTIPPSLLLDLAQVPGDRPVSLLIRHAARFPITDPYEHADVGLTPEGVRDAEVLGTLIRARFCQGRLLSSPVQRCIDTAAALARGADWPIHVQVDERLSHGFIAPGWMLVERGKLAKGIPFQVMAILHLMLRESDRSPCLDTLITHDTVVAAVNGAVLRSPDFVLEFPHYLEGLFAWQDGDRTMLRWRGITAAFSGTFGRIE